MRRPTSLLLVATLAVGPVAHVAAGPPGGAALPPAREVPGITAPDPHPNGCIDCHVVYADRGLDVRLGSALAAWTRGEVAAALLEHSRAAAPAGAAVLGRHPAADAALADIPAACLNCHEADAGHAPRFGRLVHAIHLQGGARNVFMTVYGGECTHCHKLDATTGAWRLPSGPER